MLILTQQNEIKRNKEQQVSNNLSSNHFLNENYCNILSIEDVSVEKTFRFFFICF